MKKCTVIGTVFYDPYEDSEEPQFAGISRMSDGTEIRDLLLEQAFAQILSDNNYEPTEVEIAIRVIGK